MGHTERGRENYPNGTHRPRFFTKGLLMDHKIPVGGTTSLRIHLPSAMGMNRRDLLGLVLVAMLLPSCKEGTAEMRPREGKGGKQYGGVFNINEAGEVRGLFPLGLTQLPAHRIAAQIFEGLVRFDPTDLSIKPALATEWEIDDTGTRYTFTLRKGVRFHDDPCFPNGMGREVVPEDVVHCFTALCTPGEMNLLDWLLQDLVVGVSARVNAVARGEQAPPVKGLEVTDDGRIRITLNSPSPSFLQVLAHQGCWIYPAEMVTHYGKEVAWNPVGTGAFRVLSFKRGTSLILERNGSYWGSDEHGNVLPFLDAIRYTFEKDKNIELDGFERGLLTVVSELPVERTQVLDTYADGRFQVQSTPGMSVQFYGFNQRSAPFQDVRVRKAFSMAVDRSSLVDSVLNGLAVAAEHGVVPPGFADYPYDSVPSTGYDPEGARALLAQAGFPGGSGLPPVFLQVNSDGFGYVRIAGVVQTMLERVLGVNAVITVLPADQHFERVERAEAQFWREGWVADHPDPENFLAMFYGRNAPADTSAPSYLNSTRYANEEFDGYFAKAQMTADRKERMRLLASAERRLMEDMVVIPLYHERTVRVVQPWVRDLPINGMDFIDLRGAWFDHAIMLARKSQP